MSYQCAESHGEEHAGRHIDAQERHRGPEVTDHGNVEQQWNYKGYVHSYHHVYQPIDCATAEYDPAGCTLYDACFFFPSGTGEHAHPIEHGLLDDKHQSSRYEEEIEGIAPVVWNVLLEVHGLHYR